MPRGRFITIEGGEGAGKSTQVRLLAEALERAGKTVCATREPGGSPGAEEIRRLLVAGALDRWDPLGEALLHFAARREHLTKVIWPKLAAGTWVVSDRFADSTMAYQGYGMGLEREAIEQLYALVVGDFAPDLTVILDLPVDIGFRRSIPRQGEDRYTGMGHEYHERVRRGFIEIAASHPKRCVLIDGSDDLTRVQAALTSLVFSRFHTELKGPVDRQRKTDSRIPSRKPANCTSKPRNKNGDKSQ